jgi:hypothetical protein
MLKNLKSLITRENAVKAAAGVLGAVTAIVVANRFQAPGEIVETTVTETETIELVAEDAEPVKTTTRKRTTKAATPAV